MTNILYARIAPSARPSPVRHYSGLPPEVTGGVDDRTELPRATLVVLNSTTEGVFLYRYDANGEFVTDTWHASIEDAKEQARFEYEDALEVWKDVPIHLRGAVDLRPDDTTKLT
jgi:hypothetical protein